MYKYYVEFYNGKTEQWEWVFRSNSLDVAKQVFEESKYHRPLRLVEVLEKK